MKKSLFKIGTHFVDLEKATKAAIGSTATWGDGKQYKKVSENNWEVVGDHAVSHNATPHPSIGEHEAKTPSQLHEKFRIALENMSKEHRELFRGGKMNFEKKEFVSSDGKLALVYKDGKVSIGKKHELEKADSPEVQAKIKKVMDEFKAGKLKSSSGKIVTDRNQALAIAYSYFEKADEPMTKATECSFLDDVYAAKENTLIPSDIDVQQLAMGIQVEFGEHTNDIQIAMQIAMDHLEENPVYYTKLQESGLVDEALLNTYAIENILRGSLPFNSGLEPMAKARITKYVRRILKPSGKGYIYFYNKSEYDHYKKTGELPTKAKSIFSKIISFFGLGSEKEAKEKIDTMYESHKTVLAGVGKDAFTDHVVEYITNKEKWDKKLSAPKAERKESKEGAKKEPAKNKNVVEKEGKKFNISVMRVVAEIVNEKGEENKHNIVIDYSKILSPEVKQHLKRSVDAFIAEGNNDAESVAIESDRILSEFTDKLTPSQYNAFDWDKAEEILFNETEKMIKNEKGVKKSSPEKIPNEELKQSIKSGESEPDEDFNLPSLKFLNTNTILAMENKTMNSNIVFEQLKREIPNIESYIEKYKSMNKEAQKRYENIYAENMDAKIIFDKVKDNFETMPEGKGSEPKTIEKKDFPYTITQYSHKGYMSDDGVYIDIAKKDIKSGFEIYGEKIFIVKEGKYYKSCEQKTGRKVGASGKTIEETKQNVIKALQATGKDKFKEAIAQNDIVEVKKKEKEKLKEALSNSKLTKFENSGKEPFQVTQQEWVDMHRENRKILGQESPDAEFKQFHNQEVERAIKEGKKVPENVLEDYPELNKNAKKDSKYIKKMLNAEYSKGYSAGYTDQQITETIDEWKEELNNAQTDQYKNKAKEALDAGQKILKYRKEFKNLIEKENEPEIGKTLQENYDLAKKRIDDFKQEYEDDDLESMEDDAKRGMMGEPTDSKYYIDSFKEWLRIQQYKKDLKELPSLKEKAIDESGQSKMFKARFALEQKLEKAKKATAGEVHTYKNGKKYRKEGDKWVLVTSGKDKAKEKPDTKDKKKEPDTEKNQKISKEDRHLIKNTLKRVATVIADALAGKNPNAPAAQGVEQTGEDLKSTSHKSVTEKRVDKKPSNDNKNTNTDKKE